jgi:hypothetical protein
VHGWTWLATEKHHHNKAQPPHARAPAPTPRSHDDSHAPRAGASCSGSGGPVGERARAVAGSWYVALPLGLFHGRGPGPGPPRLARLLLTRARLPRARTHSHHAPEHLRHAVFPVVRRRDGALPHAGLPLAKPHRPGELGGATRLVCSRVLRAGAHLSTQFNMAVQQVRACAACMRGAWASSGTGAASLRPRCFLTINVPPVADLRRELRALRVPRSHRAVRPLRLLTRCVLANAAASERSERVPDNSFFARPPPSRRACACLQAVVAVVDLNVQ